MKRHAIHGPMILGIFLTLLAIGLLQAATPTPASAQDGVEPPEGVSGPAAASEKAPGPPEYVPEQLLVRFRGNIPPGQAAKAMADEGAVPLKYLEALDVYLLRVPPGLTVEKAVEVFSHRFDVEYAEPNYILYLVGALHSWSDNQWAPQKIQAEQAWAAIANPAPAIIAIVDTGVDYTHSQLAPNVLADQGYDFYNNDSDPMDDHGHGTHVAGIAAAPVGTSETSMAGVCPFCKLLPVKVLGGDGSGSLDAVASGITYAADHGALVVRVGWSFGPMNLQFPHFAQYIALFVAGLVAYRRTGCGPCPTRPGAAGSQSPPSSSSRLCRCRCYWTRPPILRFFRAAGPGTRSSTRSGKAASALRCVSGSRTCSGVM